MNIFIIETPMEMVNAIEAKHYFPPDVCKLFIHTIYPRNIFTSLIKRDNWQGEIYFLKNHEPKTWANPELSRWRQFQRRMTLDRIIRMAGEADILFLDYVRAHIRHIANHIKHRQLVLLDGGTDALRVNAMRYIPADKTPDSDTGTFLKALKKTIRSKYLDLDTHEIPTVTFFTAYNLDVRPGDYLIKNDYRYLREWARQQQKTESIYFLGMPLIEDGYMLQETYFSYLHRIQKYFDSDNLVYVPHPRESDKTIRALTEKCRIPVLRFNAPIEIQMLLSGKHPTILASFFSSALENCRLIFGHEMEVMSFYLPQQDLVPGHDHVEEIFAYIQQSTCENFHMVKLGEDSN